MAALLLIVAKAALGQLAPGLKKIAVYAGIILIGLLPVIGAGVWFIYHERHIGAAQCEAEVKAATDKEQDRQRGVIKDWQQWAEKAVRVADQDKVQRDALLRKIAALAANSNAVCLPRGIAHELRAIGRPSG
jgi:hypothetical protein